MFLYAQIRALRSTPTKRALGTLVTKEPGHPLVEEAAYLVWSFLRYFQKEADSSKKFVGPSSSSSKVPFGELPRASWTTLKGVFSSLHNLGGALERITPEMIRKPEHAPTVAALKKVAMRHSMEEVATASQAA